MCPKPNSDFGKEITGSKESLKGHGEEMGGKNVLNAFAFACNYTVKVIIQVIILYIICGISICMVSNSKSRALCV